MSGPTITEAITLSQVAGGRCELRLIRDMLKNGRTLDLCVPDEHSATGRRWARIARIVPEIRGEPAPVDGTRYIMDTDDVAYRVHPGEAVWCRIAPETTKTRQRTRS